MNPIEHHKRIMDELHAQYTKKNADYGNSFADTFAEFGLLSSVIRMSDKLGRIKTLSRQQALVHDESIEDTLLDLANYAIMTVMEMRVHNDQSSACVVKST